MSSVIQFTTLDKSRQQHIINDEVNSLKKNNRELAKLLADKRNENVVLREIENNYHILESKFSILQELHGRSISNLEKYFHNACSQLSGVVDNLNILHEAIQKEKKRSVLPKDLTSNVETELTETQETVKLLSNSHPLQEMSITLRRLTSTMKIDSPGNNTKTFRDEITKAQSKMNEPTSVSLNKKSPQANISANESNNTACFYEELENAYKSPSNQENSPLKSLTVTNSMYGDSFHYSQDEFFQNFSADDDTIVRKGTDQSIVFSEKSYSNENRSILEKGNISDFEYHKVINKSQCNRKTCEDKTDEFNSFLFSHRPSQDNSELIKTIICEEADSSTEKSVNSDSVTQTVSTDATIVSSKLDVPAQQSSQHSISQMSDSSSEILSRDTGESCVTDVTDYLLKSRDSSECSSNRYFYFDPKNTQMYFRRYKNLFTDRACRKIEQQTNKESCTGKENVHSTAHLKESEQSTSQRASRKPLCDRMKETVTEIKNTEKIKCQVGNFENGSGDRCSVANSKTKVFHDPVKSQDCSAISLQTRRIIKKRVPKIKKKKIRSKRKENLRV